MATAGLGGSASAIAVIPGPRPGVYFGQALSPTIDPIHSGYIWDDFLSGKSSLSSGDIGSLGWTIRGLSSLGPAPAEASYPGSLYMTTQGAPLAVGSFSLADLYFASQFVIPSGLTLTWIYKAVFIATDVERRLGLGTNFNAHPPNTGIYIEHMPGENTWWAVVRQFDKVPDQIRVNTGVAVDNTWNRLKIAANVTTNEIDFYIDDVLVASIERYFADAVSLVPGLSLVSINAMTCSITIDFFDMRFANLVR